MAVKSAITLDPVRPLDLSGYLNVIRQNRPEEAFLKALQPTFENLEKRKTQQVFGDYLSGGMNQQDALQQLAQGPLKGDTERFLELMVSSQQPEATAANIAAQRARAANLQADTGFTQARTEAYPEESQSLIESRRTTAKNQTRSQDRQDAILFDEINQRRKEEQEAQLRDKVWAELTASENPQETIRTALNNPEVSADVKRMILSSPQAEAMNAYDKNYYTNLAKLDAKREHNMSFEGYPPSQIRDINYLEQQEGPHVINSKGNYVPLSGLQTLDNEQEMYHALIGIDAADDLGLKSFIEKQFPFGSKRVENYDWAGEATPQQKELFDEIKNWQQYVAPEVVMEEISGYLEADKKLTGGRKDINDLVEQMRQARIEVLEPAWKDSRLR